jgi:hypothetical protein
MYLMSRPPDGKLVFNKDTLKEWLTLAEVAERWTRLTGQAITENDLLHYGSTGKLTLGVITDYWWVITAAELDAYGNLVPEYCELSLSIFSYFPLDASHIMSLCNSSPTLVVSSKDARGQLVFPLVVQTSRFVSEFPSEALHICFPKSQKGSNNFTPMVDVKDLVITNGELTRFEQENNIDQSTFAEKTPTESSANAGNWKSVAQRIAEDLDPERRHPSTGAFAMEIFNELKAQGITNRNKVTPSRETIEREILRGWKTKK